MLPGNGIGDADKTCYPGSPEYKFKYGSEGLNTNDIKEYIRNPHKFNIKEEMDGQYYNLWSTDNERADANDDVVIKSVYDPSPVGYSLPASNAFTGFTTTGGNVGYWSTPLTPETKAKFNVKSEFEKGWYFYNKPNKQGGNIFFPAYGYRHFSYGFLLNMNTSGYYWLSGPCFTNYGFSLNFSSILVLPLIDGYCSCGFTVRSAEEEMVAGVDWKSVKRL